MPIYDYVCGSCGHRFEVYRGLNETGPHQCPLCSGPTTRAFAPPTILFKGSGWAKMDRRSSSASARKASEGATTGEKASGGESAGPKKTGDPSAGQKEGAPSRSEKKGDGPTTSSSGPAE